jgi:hypothetical protein
VSTPGRARAALAHPVFTGISGQQLAELIAELAGPWQAQQESRLSERRGGDRQRAVGAGPDHQLVFVDRVVATLVVLRFQLPHKALGLLYGVHRCTIDRAVDEIRPLLAARGFAVPDQPGVRLRTLADVFAYADAEGVELRIDGTEVQVRRPRAHRPGRTRFVSGKKRQNTEKATVISDGQGRTLWLGAIRPGRMHDVTQVRTEGIEDLLHRHPEIKARVDSGYQGLARDFPDQVSAPPVKPGKDAGPGQTNFYEDTRHRQSAARICVEHAIAEPKQWRPLQRWTGRHEDLPETMAAIGGLVSDRAARRPTVRTTSTELVPIVRAIC